MSGTAPWPWGELGITQTEDTTAIRRAYAAKLKGMDADQNPDAYTRLRQARDDALHRRPSGAEGAGDMATTAREAPKPEAEPETEPDDERQLCRLLLSEEDGDTTPLTDSEETEARHYLHNILKHAESADLGQQDALDHHLQEIMFHSWPRCAPLLEEAAQAMGWIRMAGRLGESDTVQFLNARLAGDMFQRDVQLHTHPFHAAWMELSRPELAWTSSVLISSRAKKRTIRLLLTHIRNNFPEIETGLNPRNVEVWDNILASTNENGSVHFHGKFIKIFAVFAILLAFYIPIFGAIMLIRIIFLNLKRASR